ncbi:hypothetical protein D8S78_21895 [Natrialba swarupiae]|nr:hypothetical protein [Natrialba swarupiae]
MSPPISDRVVFFTTTSTIYPRKPIEFDLFTVVRTTTPLVTVRSLSSRRHPVSTDLENERLSDSVRCTRNRYFARSVLDLPVVLLRRRSPGVR